MFALGLLCWLYNRPIADTEVYLRTKFADRPAHLDANVRALRAGLNYGETTEALAATYNVAPAPLPAGRYRRVSGNTALALGLVAAGNRAGLRVVVGAYPITPASDILHELAKHKNFDVVTLQTEDEIAAISAAIGASYGGALGVTATSGPGMSLKAEAIGLAVMTELPLVIIDVQRGGPSTGLPTRTEQADLGIAMHGRHGEAPLPIIAPSSPSDCFEAAMTAARIAVAYRTPVILLSDAAIANGSEAWRVPAADELPELAVNFAKARNSPDGNEFWPYLREPSTLARPLAIPGTPGLEHRIGGLEKADETGHISDDPSNHERMVRLRAAKVAGIDVPDLVVDDPSQCADTLILGWGSTFGVISSAVDRIRRDGGRIARTHVRHLNPFPPNLETILAGYDHVVVPELNLGQLTDLLNARFSANAVCLPKVTGMPFTETELVNRLGAAMRGESI